MTWVTDGTDPRLKGDEMGPRCGQSLGLSFSLSVNLCLSLRALTHQRTTELYADSIFATQFGLVVAEGSPGRSFDSLIGSHTTPLKSQPWRVGEAQSQNL